MRRGDLGEPAEDGDARRYQKVCHVDVAGLGKKVTVLIRGDLSGSGPSRDGGSAAVSATAQLNWQESADAVVPTGDVRGREGLNVR